MKGSEREGGDAGGSRTQLRSDGGIIIEGRGEKRDSLTHLANKYLRDTAHASTDQILLSLRQAHFADVLIFLFRVLICRSVTRCARLQLSALTSLV